MDANQESQLEARINETELELGKIETTTRKDFDQFDPMVEHMNSHTFKLLVQTSKLQEFEEEDVNLFMELPLGYLKYHQDMYDTLQICKRAFVIHARNVHRA